MRRYKDEWHTMQVGYLSVRVSVLVPTLYGRWCLWMEARRVTRAYCDVCEAFAEAGRLQAEYQLKSVTSKWESEE